MDKARMLAVKLLQRCEDSGYANLVLKNALDREQLETRDKQFVTALVHGTLEKQRLLDALLDTCLKKPCAKLDAPVRAILRSGLYQCRWMDSVPDHAAVNTAVDLTRRVGKSSAAGMVNAVLRKASKIDVKSLNFTNDAARLGTLYSVSDSIATMLLSAYPTQAEAILQAMSEPAPLVLRANTLRTTAEQLCETLGQQGIAAQPVSEIPGALLLPKGGDIAHTQAFADGLFHVQGLSSQLAALTLAPRPGDTVLDLCAAPGGKSLTLAQQMRNTGSLYCGELQAARVQLISKQLERCGVTCATVRCADAAVFDEALPKADRSLCDVPCSGTGVLAKKPDIRYKDLDDSRQQLTALQLNILCTASRYLKSGGHLVYSTCSLDTAENAEVVKAFLQQNSDFRVLPVQLPIPEDAVLYQPEGATLLPSSFGNDGFFIAKLEKI